MTNRKIILCAFSSPNLIRSAKRLKKQAIDMKCYDEINIISINDLDSYGQEYIKNILKKGKKKGYGYWFWKPYMIKHYLDLMNDNDVLHYCDMGCHLRMTENKRFKEYINILESNGKGILAFQYKEILNLNLKNLTFPLREEFKFTKSDLFEYFKVIKNREVTHTPQFWAGNIFLKKNNFTDKFVQNWLDVFKNRFDLIDDTESKIENFPKFIENRHDQSVFSILCKLNKIKSISAYECDWAILNGQRTWNHAENNPILAKRDLKYGIFERFISRQRKNIKRKINYFKSLKKS